MPSVLIVHASRHGGSKGIADRIGEVLSDAGVATVVAPATAMTDPADFDACVVGAGVYMGSWVDEGIAYLERYRDVLAARPVWIFSSGPLTGSTKQPKHPITDRVELALGPAEGPGSGGRRKLEAAVAPIHPREHRVFDGAFDPTDSAKTIAERVLRMLPGSKGILPPGDFRDWQEIEAWATEIARAVEEPLRVA